MASQLPHAGIDLIPAALRAHIPGYAAGRPPREVAVLAGGGRHNSCVVVTTDEGRFVLRWRVAQGERPGASGPQELRSHLAAASLGIAPGIVAAAPDGRWLLMEYLDAPCWHKADLHEPTCLEALGLRLAQLHEMSPRGVGSLDVMSIIEGQSALILARDPASAAQVAALQDQARTLSARIAEFGARTVLNHGDLAASNLLGPQPMMVDWEYAQRADPVYDLACLLSYYPTLEPQLDRLLGAAGLADAGSRERLGVYRALFEVFNVLWREAQAESHGDPAGIVTRPPAE